MRSCRVDPDNLRAVLVMACKGRSMRPARSQDNPNTTTTMMARARSERVQSWRRASCLQLVLGLVEEDRQGDAVDEYIPLHVSGVDAGDGPELESARGDLELLRDGRPGLFGSDGQTVAHHEVVGGDEDDARQQEQAPIP